jgi:ferredoxin
MKAAIDSAKCQGHGLCYTTAPEVFGDDEEGYGYVLHGGDVEPGHEADARRGASNCPEQAITLG